MTTEAECFACLADACLEHDEVHYARALAALVALRQREAADAVEQAEGQRR